MKAMHHFCCFKSEYDYYYYDRGYDFLNSINTLNIGKISKISSNYIGILILNNLLSQSSLSSLGFLI
jgi:hypothetical protein